MPGEALSRLRLQVALVWGSGPADTGRLRRLQVLWVPPPPGAVGHPQVSLSAWDAGQILEASI